MNDGPYGNALSRPTREALLIGSGVLEQALSEVPEGFVLISQPGPLAHVPPRAVARAGKIVEASSLDLAALDRLVGDAAAPIAVVGIGGGVVMDGAKWLSYRSGAPLVLAPSILSADACVTNSVAVRVDGKVDYRGFVQARRVVIDVDLISSAPARLNRAGIGDLLSIHTALWDWAAGERAGRGTVDGTVARRSSEILDSLEAVADGVRTATAESLATIITGYAEINDMVMACGHAMMEEGSEHYLGYLIEYRTGRSFVHGELVTLGVILMSTLQGNDPARARAIAERAGVRWRPRELEIPRDVLADALMGLRDYVTESGFGYSVANELPIDAVELERLLAEVL